MILHPLHMPPPTTGPAPATPRSTPLSMQVPAITTFGWPTLLSSTIGDHVHLTTVCGYVFLTEELSYHTELLSSQQVPTEAKQVHVFKEQDLTEYLLLSVSKLCKAGLRVVFTDSSVNAYDSNHTTRLHGIKIHTQAYTWCDYPPLRATL